jgi:hypothetical protein
MCLRSTEPTLCTVRVIASGFCPPSLQTIVSIVFLCHCRVGCALRFLFFLKRWKFFKNNFSFGSALQALLYPSGELHVGLRDIFLY